MLLSKRTTGLLPTVTAQRSLPPEMHLFRKRRDWPRTRFSSIYRIPPWCLLGLNLTPVPLTDYPRQVAT
ncbi:hypothetical protein SCP_0509610 [Sparassis crispa]|uniref:Uncharacterized protein n=1 Tax=Sparassis crispa TaxID=139825 RepID=A0A401GNX1_9APHY|nr:hypothetical protein SCP_0509610 [Sparassis crispa]GBE83902.1 hypothetical protein SCP_0509610 [Sparassis crispa]